MSFLGNPTLSVAEYFAGIGLVRMGLQPCGWQVIFSNDISEKKFEMYQMFYPYTHNHYVVKDIFDINPQTVPLTMLATCSFPCIDLSLAGNMGGINAKHSSAFWGFTKVLDAQGDLAPPIVLVENVVGWLHSNKGADFRVTVEALNKLGYACDVFILNALSFTPQSRPRVFLVGARFPLADSAIDMILKRPRSLLSPNVEKSIAANSDLRWHYLPLPAPPPLRKNGLASIVEDIPERDERWWPIDEVERHLAMMDDAHNQRVIRLAEHNQITFRTFFRRRRNGYQRAEVRDDDVAGCLRTAIGGSGKQFLIKAGMGKIRMRAMTPREYARLQGVSDLFPIHVNGVQALTGFGDAVCVPVITWIAEHALAPLAEKYSRELAKPGRYG